MTSVLAHIAILGGTGAQGHGLAVRWARAGHPITIGSRDMVKAEATAAKIRAAVSGAKIDVASYADATATGDIVVIAVPFSAQASVASDIKDVVAQKVVVDVTAPIAPPRVSQVQIPAAGSAAQSLQHLLGAEARVVSAFQNISAKHLTDFDHAIECDVLVCADDDAAADTVLELAQELGVRALRAGPLSNAVVAEALTAILIGINRRYKSPGAGIRITGLP